MTTRPQTLAPDQGYSRLAVFGSVSSFEFVRFKQLIEKVLGRGTVLVEYGGLQPSRDDDFRRAAVLL